jgi:hypothetical protein
MTMGLVAEVVVHLTFGRRSFPTIPTSQTLISLPIFQDKRMSLQWDFV